MLDKTGGNIVQEATVVSLGAFCASRIIGRGLGIVVARPSCKWAHGIRVLRALIHAGFGMMALSYYGGEKEELVFYACAAMIVEWCTQQYGVYWRDKVATSCMCSRE